MAPRIGGPKLGNSPFKVGESKTKVNGQVKYGPTGGLNDKQKQHLNEHYGKHGAGVKKQNVLVRLTQYNSSHSTYTNAAQASGRPLTPQELAARKTGQNAPDSSINHVIASATGQNVFNHETLRFKQGAKDTTAATGELKTATGDALTEAQKKTRKGLAEQAASVGRVQGYSRATLAERKGELKAGAVQQKQDAALKNTLTAMQGPDQATRFQAYKDVLKDTFDAPGNLRVGDITQNKKISTGFDAPLDKNGKPTARAERLYQAHQNYGPERLLTDGNVFTKNNKGEIMSSSQHADGPNNKRKAEDDGGGPSKPTKRR
ncbi:hypothetical protein [Corallococcus terminator]|uniref:Uncharacterized protein n=1 Tax=Corallococcus terminator TaxID=2316733 RepID=A0A3A8HS88_9BACT|nr:hypothetical protein [Corallococcus terminator]RKG73316.1 hypothetical protein D7V88_36650 [Corallococcus terminator]